jgi:hypothetical protein
MKIGIITLTGDNYGAILQTYALCTKLNGMGFDTEIIRYLDKHRIMRSLSLAGKVKYLTRCMLKCFVTFNRKHRNFNRFRNSRIKWSPVNYDDHRKIKKNPPRYDVYITGSDQVWNPEIYRYDLNYLLDFVPDNAFSFSYAASFGKGILPDYAVQNTKRLLSRMKAISVREKSGLAIVQSLGFEAHLVLDPTLLLNKDEWTDFTMDYRGKYKDKRYVVCYIMPGDKVVCDAILFAGKRMSQILQLPLVILGAHENKCFTHNYDVTAGPDDFLYIVRNAAFVATNSFHGVCFSVNFNVPFIVPVNEASVTDVSLSTRIISLLKLTGLSEALTLVSEQHLFDGDDLKTQNDFTYANTVLEQLRISSLDFIRDTLTKYPGKENTYEDFGNNAASYN